MISDEMERQLHDKVSRGESLTAKEQAQLTTWYAAQDAAEADLLPSATVEVDLEALQRQVDTASTQLTAVTGRLQQVTAENNSLRREITRLRQ